MKVYSLAAVAAVGAVLFGCATIVEGTTQSVSVNTAPEQGAQCALVNSEGTWYVTTPGTTTVHKTKTDLDVTCTKAGFQNGHVVAYSHFGATTAANVIAGGVIGAGVDAFSGANYHYDSPISVPLGPPVSAQTAPASPVQAPPPSGSKPGS